MRVTRFLEERHLHGERAVGVQDEGGAVEHQFVLAADQGGEHIGQAGFHHALDGQRDAAVLLAVLERASR